MAQLPQQQKVLKDDHYTYKIDAFLDGKDIEKDLTSGLYKSPYEGTEALTAPTLDQQLKKEKQLIKLYTILLKVVGNFNTPHPNPDKGETAVRNFFTCLSNAEPGELNLDQSIKTRNITPAHISFILNFIDKLREYFARTYYLITAKTGLPNITKPDGGLEYPLVKSIKRLNKMWEWEKDQVNVSEFYEREKYIKLIAELLAKKDKGETLSFIQKIINDTEFSPKNIANQDGCDTFPPSMLFLVNY